MRDAHSVLDLPFAAPLLVLLGATTVAIAAAIGTGLRRLRLAHVRVVATAGVLFVATVAVAESMGRVCAIPRWALDAHLPWAHAATVALLATVVTGVWRWRRGSGVAAHRASVLTFVLLLLVAVATGWQMLAVATPRPGRAPALDATISRRAAAFAAPAPMVKERGRTQR